jgi:hypothetical protein
MDYDRGIDNKKTLNFLLVGPLPAKAGRLTILLTTSG